MPGVNLKSLYKQSKELRLQQKTEKVGSEKWKEATNELLKVTLRITQAHLKLEKMGAKKA